MTLCLVVGLGPNVGFSGILIGLRNTCFVAVGRVCCLGCMW